MQKTTEQNRIVRTGKSEAEIINDKNLRSGYCRLLLNLTTDRQKHRAASFDSRAVLVFIPHLHSTPPLQEYCQVCVATRRYKFLKICFIRLDRIHEREGWHLVVYLLEGVSCFSNDQPKDQRIQSKLENVCTGFHAMMRQLRLYIYWRDWHKLWEETRRTQKRSRIGTKLQDACPVAGSGDLW